jgi:hypothetical protein
MKNTPSLTILVASLIVAHAAIAAPKKPLQGENEVRTEQAEALAKGQAVRLMAAAAGDISASAIKTYSSAFKSEGAPVRREAVALSWATDGQINLAQKPFIGESREYQVEVSGAQLADGVTLHTTAARALVRMQPLGGRASGREKAAINPMQMSLKSADGQVHAAGSGMEMLMSAEKLAKAEQLFAAGTSAFRLHAKMGSGDFKLQAQGLNSQARYMINVVEPDSNLAMTMQTGAANYLHGQELVVNPAMIEQDSQDGKSGKQETARHAFAKLDGFVTSPGGRRFPINFKAGQDGQLHASLPLDADEAPTPGLWEVSANGQAQVKGQTVQRSLRLAFAVAMPTARLDGDATLFNAADGVGLRFGIDSGAPGRYEVRALLYGTVKGVLTPVGIAYSAKWLEAGKGNIALSYKASLLDGVSPPYEIGDLTLLDQSRMGILHKQVRAVVIEERDAALAGLDLSHRDLVPRKKSSIPVKR